jgi:MoaA/NifB/PqqE/SkfB family radical SAM enzyme
MNKIITPCYFQIHDEKDVYQVSYEITNICDLRCFHCCNKSSSGEDAGLSRDNIFSLINDLITINVNSIYLTGGEPTLHPDFSSIVDYIHKNNIDLALATNGNNVENLPASLTAFNKTKEGVFVSIDGIERTHDKLRGVDGAFKNALKTINALLNKDVPVRISSIIWKENISELEEMIQLSKSIGVYKLHFSMLFNAGRAAANDINISESQYRDICNKVNELAEKYADDNFVVSMRRNHPLNTGCDYCHGAEKILHINSKGYVFPCSWIAKTELGGIYSFKWEKNSFHEDLYNLQKFQKLVNERIELYGYSGCPAIAYSVTKNPHGEDPLNKLLNYNEK